MNTNYEAAIYSSPKKMQKVYITMIVATVLAWVSFAAGNYFWDDYTETVRVIATGVITKAGWPVTLYWWGLMLGVTLPPCFLMVYFMQDKKNPSLAVCKEGLYVNQQLISKTLVEWKNISRIEKTVGSNVSVSIYFKNVQEVIAKQAGIKKPFLKETFKTNGPLVIDNGFSTGDLSLLADKANEYLTKES